MYALTIPSPQMKTLCLNIYYVMNALYTDNEGNIFDLPGTEPLFRSGRRTLSVSENEMIPLPYGSYLFSLPGRLPMVLGSEKEKPEPLRKDPTGRSATALSAHCASAYLRTLLPAFKRTARAPALSLWAYAGVALLNEGVHVAAMRIDPDRRSDPELHEETDLLNDSFREKLKRYPDNRLVRQLVTCSGEYGCLCARNFFLGRFEAPLPSSPACNSGCLGCLSHQPEASAYRESQFRLTFSPTAEELAEVMLEHFDRVPEGIASFGQGCEGEPLLRGKDLARAISLVREKTGAGTINCNTNGSLPEALSGMIDAGLDSVRISLNSATEEYYNAYYRPRNYTFDDVKRSMEKALDAGIYLSLNLFFLPGFTDSDPEVATLFDLLDEFPVQMIQTRNLNMDPDIYLDSLGFEDPPAVGIKSLLGLMGERYPDLRFGYYNPSLI